MLRESDLLGVNSPCLQDISLRLYKKFYDNVLCKKIFRYTLENGKVIVLLFSPNNFMHIIGAQHMLGNDYKATKFNQKIESGELTLKSLQETNAKAFSDYTDRILGFSSLYYVLTNCSIISFDKAIYNNNITAKGKAKIDFDYIIFKDINNKKIHLGLDTYNRGKTYYPKSMLISSALNNVLIKDQIQIPVVKIEVIDRYRDYKKAQEEVAATIE